MKLTPTEDQIQSALIQHLHYQARQPVVYFAVPNGGFRHRGVANILKATGTTPGIPDLVFALEQGRTFWLEMKAHKGVLSDAQKGIRYKLEQLGHAWAMARSVDEALAILGKAGMLK